MSQKNLLTAQNLAVSASTKKAPYHSLNCNCRLSIGRHPVQIPAREPSSGSGLGQRGETSQLASPKSALKGDNGQISGPTPVSSLLASSRTMEYALYTQRGPV